MPNHRLVEAVLILAQGRDRAVTTLGDLEETSAERGRFWFWRAVASIVASRIAFPLLAFAAANLAFFVLAQAERHWFFAGRFVVLHLRTPSDFFWTNVVGACTKVSVLVGAYTSLRFGIRNRLAQLSGAASIVAVLTEFLWWKGVPPWMAVSPLGAFVVVSLGTREGRRALGLMAAFGTTFVGLFYVASTLFLALANHIADTHKSAFGSELHALWWGSMESLLGLAFILYSVLRTRLFETARDNRSSV